MEVFQNDGHLSDAAITALVENRITDELTRLEIAEHLAYCDECLMRYTNALEGIPLLKPSKSCRVSLLRRLRQRTVRILTSRYATAAAAMTIALTLVWADIPQPNVTLWEHPLFTSEANEWSDAFKAVQQHFNRLFQGLDPAYDGGKMK